MPDVRPSTKRGIFLFLVALAIAIPAFVLMRQRNAPAPSPAATRNADGSRSISPELAAQLAAIEQRELKIAETVWAKELLAQECGRTFEAFWDSVIAASNKLDVVASFSFGEIILGNWNSTNRLPHGIQSRESSGTGPALSAIEWMNFVTDSAAAGWKLMQTEFRHNRFDTTADDQPRQSRFYFSAHLTNGLLSRAVVEGDLIVDWASRSAGDEFIPIKRIDASGLSIKMRDGEPLFKLILAQQIKPPEHSQSIDPLIVHDVDGDGFPEIILVAKNLIFRRTGVDRYEAASLFRHPPDTIYTAILGDFDGDGIADLLCHKFRALVLMRGSVQGTFEEPERIVWKAPADVNYPMVMTCGDMDQDGDLDVFLGQYKDPYEGGSVPTPFHNANDGNPSYLFVNDGHGNLTDATATSGLARKRWRRCYSSSFVDLDDDGHLDLVVVSDFAGLDLYRNDGKGYFTDVTDKWVNEPHAFGMGHGLADFNADGILDLLMIGMTSPTVERLDHLQLWRPESTEDRTMRSRMAAGNRLYFGRSSGGFDLPVAHLTINRSGWSWGCGAFDFDNDGFPDVFIANGLESRQTVRDYEAEFWLHDQFVGTSRDDPASYLYFTTKFTRTRGRGMSYGGYEKNRFYINQAGRSFLEAGHLSGLAIEQDSRNVVSEDVDADGRPDLIVTSFETWPEARQTLRVYKNTSAQLNNWIGFRFRNDRPGRSSIGAQVRIQYAGRQAVRQIVAGDSYRSQHSTSLHFGLGDANRVTMVEIRWADGRSLAIRDPEVNQSHLIQRSSEAPGNH